MRLATSSGSATPIPKKQDQLGIVGPSGPKQLSEEEKLKKRSEHIEEVKQTPGYLNFKASRDAGSERARAASSLTRSRTPDPNRTCSKREWEENVRAWRSFLKEWEMN